MELDLTIRCQRAIRALTINGAPYELPYVPESWLHRKRNFYTYGHRMIKVAQRTARQMQKELAHPVVLSVVTWREPDDLPREGDGAIGGYRIYRMVPAVTPGIERTDEEREAGPLRLRPEERPLTEMQQRIQRERDRALAQRAKHAEGRA